MSRPCPCASAKTYDKCCEPFVTGRAVPETAEKLMRSRFTAYALGKADYLAATTAAEERAKLDLDELGRYVRSVKCISLKVLSTEAGGPGDEAGVVTFHAKLQINGRRMLHRERSRFVREEGRWAYVDGETN
ncbi:MAG TPA: YchJ family metal-binding protein [Holophaga sp.]|nr:YchJ family metal-binding protein [Holophaga sp.]